MNKKAISNNALSILVIIALAVAIAGITISFSEFKTVEMTGLASTIYGHLNATVSTATDISFNVAQVNFTDQAVNTVNDTTDEAPPPFNISNDGNVCVNITLVRTQTGWFSGASITGGDLNNNNHTTYQVASIGANIPYWAAGTNTSWTNLSQSITSQAIGHLNWTNGNDTAQIEIQIHVPSDETGGAKNTLVTFAAVDSSISC